MPTAVTSDLKDRVQNVLNQIRPAIQADGGDIELANIAEGGVVEIRFHGACDGCPSANMTLQLLIEKTLHEQIPEVTRVIPVL